MCRNALCVRAHKITQVNLTGRNANAESTRPSKHKQSGEQRFIWSSNETDAAPVRRPPCVFLRNVVALRRLHTHTGWLHPIVVLQSETHTMAVLMCCRHPVLSGARNRRCRVHFYYLLRTLVWLGEHGETHNAHTASEDVWAIIYVFVCSTHTHTHTRAQTHWL